MDCERVSEDMSYQIYGLCWTDDHTLIVADKESGVYKYTVDIGEKTCTGEMIDSGYRPRDASCTKDGRVYITESTQDNISVQIRIYNLKTDITEIWRPNIISDYTRISVNENKIIISFYHESYVYTNNHEFLYIITHPQVERNFVNIYLSPTDIFWGCTGSKRSLLIINLLTNETKIYGGGSAYAVSGTHEGHVFVSDSGLGGTRVYSHSGVFLHKLEMGHPQRSVGENGAILSKDGKIYLAFRVFDYSFPVVIYSIGT